MANAKFLAILGPPFSYFRHSETFFSKSPFTYLMFYDRMDVEKSQMVPSFSFFRIVRLSGENFLMTSMGPPFNFLMFCDRKVEKSQIVSLLARQFGSIFGVFGHC